MTARLLKPKKSALSVDEMTQFLQEVFPQAMGRKGAQRLSVEEVGYGACRVRMKFSDQQLRPGGTISGPTMMGLSDFAIYVAILTAIGRVPLAVTTNLNINFMKKPAPGDLIADCTLLKVGKRLCIGEARLHTDGDEELVAHATATYSVPPDRGGAPEGLSPPLA